MAEDARNISQAKRSTAGGAALPSEPPLLERPRLRGVVHQWAFFVAVALAAALAVWAPGGRATAACAVYGAALVGLLGTSALYHRVTWRPRARAWLRRLDHSMIFVLIAGTYTPFALLVLEGPLSIVVLVGVWSGAASGVVLSLRCTTAPAWLMAAACVGLGWFGLIALPQIAHRAGPGALALLIGGGIAYTAGAVVYALRTPDPFPVTFGYHEIFHVLVVIAAAAHFAAVAAFAVPLAASG